MKWHQDLHDVKDNQESIYKMLIALHLSFEGSWSHVCQGSVAVNAARKVMSISEEQMSVQRYLQCTLWCQRHPVDRLQQADSPDIQAVCLKVLKPNQPKASKSIQDISRCAVTNQSQSGIAGVAHSRGLQRRQRAWRGDLETLPRQTDHNRPPNGCYYVIYVAYVILCNIRFQVLCRLVKWRAFIVRQ